MPTSPLKTLPFRYVLVHQVADALDADECGVALVAVEHVVLDAQLTQRADAADAQ